jgi:hypothetical protein
MHCTGCRQFRGSEASKTYLEVVEQISLPERYTKEIPEVQGAGDGVKLLIRHMVR